MTEMPLVYRLIEQKIRQHEEILYVDDGVRKDVPRNLNPEILSHRFNRIFISYAHQDTQQIKLLALAYKAQGVDYFYDRDSLAPGDVYEEKIFDYIDSSDLFVLCWSKNTAASDYVAKKRTSIAQSISSTQSNRCNIKNMPNQY